MLLLDSINSFHCGLPCTILIVCLVSLFLPLIYGSPAGLTLNKVFFVLFLFLYSEYACTKETWVQNLGLDDSLEKEMANHSCILAWRRLCTEEPGGLQSMGLQIVGHD